MLSDSPRVTQAAGEGACIKQVRLPVVGLGGWLQQFCSQALSSLTPSRDSGGKWASEMDTLEVKALPLPWKLQGLIDFLSLNFLLCEMGRTPTLGDRWRGRDKLC